MNYRKTSIEHWYAPSAEINDFSHEQFLLPFDRCIYVKKPSHLAPCLPNGMVLND